MTTRKHDPDNQNNCGWADDAKKTDGIWLLASGGYSCGEQSDVWLAIPAGVDAQKVSHIVEQVYVKMATAFESEASGREKAFWEPSASDCSFGGGGGKTLTVKLVGEVSDGDGQAPWPSECWIRSQKRTHSDDDASFTSHNNNTACTCTQ